MTTGEKEKEYKKGDVVWYLSAFVAVRCTIVEVQDEFRKKHPMGVIYYWLDEPVGHAVDAEELYDTREEAEVALREWIMEIPHSAADVYSLDDERRRVGRFLKKTHAISGLSPERIRAEDAAVDEWLKTLPPKERGTDWFCPRDLEGVKLGYQVGEQAWYIGHQNGVSLGILCTIREVDDIAFRADPRGGILSYVLDEPTLSTVSSGEFFLDRRSAEFDLMEAAKADPHIAESRGGLDEFRAGCEGTYPPKKRGEEWFTVADAIASFEKT